MKTITVQQERDAMKNAIYASGEEYLESAGKKIKDLKWRTIAVLQDESTHNPAIVREWEWVIRPTPNKPTRRSKRRVARYIVGAHMPTIIE